MITNDWSEFCSRFQFIENEHLIIIIKKEDDDKRKRERERERVTFFL